MNFSKSKQLVSIIKGKHRTKAITDISSVIKHLEEEMIK